jgi:ribosomal protein L17
MACRTCDLIRGLLMSGGIPESVADTAVTVAEPQIVQAEKKVSRKASAYAKKYGKAFKKVAKKYKKKSGGWKVNGFKRAQKEAHKLAKRMR